MRGGRGETNTTGTPPRAARDGQETAEVPPGGPPGGCRRAAEEPPLDWPGTAYAGVSRRHADERKVAPTIFVTSLARSAREA